MHYSVHTEETRQLLSSYISLCHHSVYYSFFLSFLLFSFFIHHAHVYGVSYESQGSGPATLRKPQAKVCDG